jgi:hypothetical protein
MTTIASDTLPETMSFSFQHASSWVGDLLSFMFPGPEHVVSFINCCQSACRL